MKLYVILGFLYFIGLATCANDKAVVEDNEFAEFEDGEQVLESATSKEVYERKEFRPVAKDDDFGIEDFDGEEPEKQEEPPVEPKVEMLKFTDVPAHFRSSWSSYQVEGIILFVIALYLVNYVTGRSQNQSVATEWFDKCRPQLLQQFSLVGDDGVGDNLAGGVLTKETDYSYIVWCSGRVGVAGLLMQLKTQKRQDLLSRLMSFFTPTNDKFTMKFELDPNEVDPFVIAVGQKKAVAKQVKEMLDLSTYAVERKNTTIFNLPSSFALFAEQAEASHAFFDNAFCNLLKKYEKAIECIHISDQYSGPRPPEGETYTKMPTTINLVQFTINFNECQDDESLSELLTMIFYLVDKMRKIRLSKEAKTKADKRRREVLDAFMKTTHQLRQEAAQARREEKTRERKQRLMEEEDPDKQRRLERMELKREAKAKQPKMKQLKMKM